jgi:hypothetical protein
MICSSGFLNNCHLNIYYNDPVVIIGWMIFAIVTWQLKSLIWTLVKWIFWFAIGIGCMAAILLGMGYIFM